MPPPGAPRGRGAGVRRLRPPLSGARRYSGDAPRRGAPPQGGRGAVSLMRRLIDELPAQLRWAAAAEVPELPGAGEGLVVGMGGAGFARGVAAGFAAAQGGRAGG